MAVFNWDDKIFSVYVKDFDAHHKKLVSLLNCLYDNMVQGKGKSVILLIVEELKQYSIYHFSAEENEMLKTAYPDYEQHKLQHELFAMQVNEFIEKINNGNLQISAQIYLFLKEWLINHIMQSDKKLGKFIIEKNNA